MPIYEYQASGKKSCGHCRERFEELQSVGDAPLAACPKCGAPVRRAISATRTPIKSNIDISNKRVGDLGFTRYEKKGKGYYEKTAGKGPRSIIKGD
jgi:putative FmdB family regulatory protein